MPTSVKNMDSANKEPQYIYFFGYLVLVNCTVCLEIVAIKFILYC